jgi:hypothetical protein
MAFAYNTSFHRTLKATPFKITFGQEARTANFNQRRQYGEETGTELFQRMETSHESMRQLAREHTDVAIKRNMQDHDKKANPRSFKVGDTVLIQVKDFLTKNKKLAESFKGPFLVTRVSPNNTATIRSRTGKKEYNYNTDMLKMYYSTETQSRQQGQNPSQTTSSGASEPQSKKTSRQQGQNPSQTTSSGTSESKRDDKTKLRPRQKPSQNATSSDDSSEPKQREGPVTRSRTAARAAFSYSEALQGKSIIEVQTIKEFAESQKKIQSIQTEDNASFKQKQKLAEFTHAEHVKMNQQQWATLKASVKNETTRWKNSLIQNEWCNLGPKFKTDTMGLPLQQEGIAQPKWVQNRRKFLASLTFKERNLVLTGDPFVEFDPFTYVLVYSFPRQAQNYPAIVAALPHIANNNNIIIQEPEVPPPAAPAAPAAPRGRGRPLGSKNKPKTAETTGPTRDRRLKRTSQTIKSDTVLASDKNLVKTPPQVTTLVSRSKSTGNAQTISSVNILKSAQAIDSRFFQPRFYRRERGFTNTPTVF